MPAGLLSTRRGLLRARAACSRRQLVLPTAWDCRSAYRGDLRPGLRDLLDRFPGCPGPRSAVSGAGGAPERRYAPPFTTPTATSAPRSA